MGVTDHIARFGRLTNDFDGLEKTLRFIQFIFFTLAASRWTSITPSLWKLNQQIYLGRRYFRIFKFIDCFVKGSKRNEGSGNLLDILESWKWNAMGLFLFMEAMTMLDAMGVWEVSWAGPLFKEACKFWFYSVVLSITQSLIRLRDITITKSKSEASDDFKAVQGTSGEKLANQTIALVKLIVLDLIDLLIPGSITGWIKIDAFSLGVTVILSTGYRLVGIWGKC